ncbi:MAG: OmpA family protein [Ignavibacteriae bacterium]|nr:OmpA family protein [Ignavibacteriota bacterium]
MKRNLLICLLGLLFGCGTLLSQSGRSINVGVGGGLTRGVNESIDGERSLGSEFGVMVLFHNGILPGLSPELSFQVASNKTADLGGFSQYQTNYITPDLRLRFYPLPSSAWMPYISAGVGLMIYDNKSFDPLNMSVDATLNSASLAIPIGAGVTYFIKDDNNQPTNWMFDLSIQSHLTSTDDLNPIHDGVNDAYWDARLSVMYRVYTFEKDTDGDGLSDIDEISYGSDVNNPDSDGDGLLDGEEVHNYKTNPVKADTDDGGVNDGIEVRLGANPLDPDDDILSIGAGQKIALRAIEFNTGDSTLTKQSERILGFALKAFQAVNDITFEISGHTDDVGARDMNMSLSSGRANAVKAWLVTHGIAESRMTTRGAGPDEPLVPNSNPENRQRNRRVQFMRTK